MWAKECIVKSVFLDQCLYICNVFIYPDGISDDMLWRLLKAMEYTDLSSRCM